MIAKSGHIVGETVATLVNFFNPAVVAFGGTIATTGDQFLAAARETVYRRSLPLATRNLRIVSASPDHSEGLIGVAALLTERLFQPGPLRRWILSGSPRSDVTSLYGVAV
jgi:predicted NBD/HSP70 family sugar kinase